MKAFKFSLESLIELRMNEEQQALHELGLKLEKQVQAQQRLKSTTERIIQCHGMVNQLMTSQCLSLLDIHNHNEYLRELRRLELAAKKDFDQASRMVAECRQNYHKKKSDSEVLTKLRERNYQEHVQRLEKIEARQIDDLVNSRHNRQRLEVI